MIQNIMNGLKPEIRQIPGGDAMNVHLNSY
jgi:hypothetical protein